jgi:hypothetical protein
MATQKKRAPKKDPEVLRKELMADPNTKGIAKNLGVDLKEYVDQVIHFVMNPKDEPSLYIVEDEDLKAMGLEPLDEKAVGQYIVEAAKVSAAADSTEYTDPKKKLVSMDNLPPVQATEKTDKKLQDELKKQLSGKRGGKS